MNHIGRGNIKHPYVFESRQATHVVTGILYGAQAFFVFDREVSEKEDRQVIEGNLKVLIKKIPALTIDGQGSLNMADTDIANVEKFSCKFHGDFNLEKHPVSFQEAIEVYQSLPKLMGTNGANAVPQKVWLMPLKALDSGAAQLVRQISERLIRDAQNVLEDLSELERRSNDAERCTTAQQFPQINKKLKAFKELVSQHKLEFQNHMARKLPLIRGGGEEESVLAKILKKVHSSPFKSGELNEWMECKETEIKIISSLIDKMPNMTIVTNRNTLHHEIHSEDVRHTVCFVFTSLETPEPFLSALSNYLDETQPDDVPCAKDLENKQWFFSNVIYEKIKLFKDFAVANKENKSVRFLTAAIRDDEKKGATLHLYKDGSLVNNNFEPPSKPEMITGDITHNSVTLNISPPRFGLTTVTHYTVEFCVDGDDIWHKQMESKAGDVTVSGLKINEEYKIRCRAKCAVGLGPACDDNALIKTLPTSPPEKSKEKSVVVCTEKPPEAVKKEGRKITGPPDSLDVHTLPLKAQPINVEGCERFIFGKDSGNKNRTIMVLGATGAGKSTLVNRMINYILGVKWDDTFRFKLADEGAAKSQAHSQTSEVTVYKLNHREGFQIDYSLTIVDTPGFGDTGGIEKDRMIRSLQRIFSAEHGVSEIDAICFVAQASLAWLTPLQKYIFESVLSIFGKDVAENIRILVTFADGTKPTVLDAINESAVPCPKEKDGLPIHFKFNNSLFADNKVLGAKNKSEDNDDDDDDEDGDGFHKTNWDMGTNSMNRFFSALNFIETKSLTLTKEVLRKRGELENLQIKVKLGLAKLVAIKQESEILQTHEAAITANEEFEYEVIFMKPVQADISKTGKYITNCQQCEKTCHFPCSIPNDAEKSRCRVMGPDGNCTQCENKCHWMLHFNQKYHWDYEQVTEKLTYKDLKEKYEKASEKAMSVVDVIKKMELEYDLLQEEVVRLKECSAECLNTLKEIALKPNPLSTPEYIDLMIEGEKSEAKPGYLERIEKVQHMREKAGKEIIINNKFYFCRLYPRSPYIE
uniref:Fibronectin type-III domain-containing protein n=2 Tax=Gadus morhua TaxID=8049 RepID=A0A8C5CGK1_GADMO